jgi:hypothetical protein
MSTYEHDLLTARFAAIAPRPVAGDWDDVLDRARAAHPRRRRLARSLLRGGRRRKLVVLAVAALVAAVAAAAYGTVRVLILDKGFIGLPPVGAAPSAPERGELELSYWVTSPRQPGNPGWVYAGSRAWVYADGRLIWLREGADTSEAASRFSSGFLEQRLTPEGVELMRSEIASTGLFDHDRNLVGDGADFNQVELRNGDRLVRVRMHYLCSFGPPPCTATTATPAQVNAFERLAARLNDPAAWLPASAWADRKIRAYVPSRFAVCFDSFGAPSSSHSFEPSELLAALPATVEDVLSGRYEKTQFFSAHPSYCASVTSEEARTLDKALDDAGLEGGTTDKVVRYVFRVPGPIREPAEIFFEPYLPHGEVTCSVCG